MRIPIIILAPSKFPLGQLVITSNAASQLPPATVRKGLRRHASGDWGELCPEDARGNAAALKHGDRLLSVYGQGDKRFWIITEADRSVTTVLMPEDY
jgi:hypothetical protein